MSVATSRAARGILFFIAAFVCIFGLQFATARGREQVAIGLLFGLGLALGDPRTTRARADDQKSSQGGSPHLAVRWISGHSGVPDFFRGLLGLAVAPVLNAYAKTDPAAVWQAAGATAATVAGLGAIGYATRRDLSSWVRLLFWALLALIVFGVALIFVNIPHVNIIYAVLGIVIFGGYTIVDFNRLPGVDVSDSVPIAASIFFDIFNIVLFFLQLFASERN